MQWEEGVNAFTLLHHDLNICTNSVEYFCFHFLLCAILCIYHCANWSCFLLTFFWGLFAVAVCNGPRYCQQSSALCGAKKESEFRCKREHCLFVFAVCEAAMRANVFKCVAFSSDGKTSTNWSRYFFFRIWLANCRTWNSSFTLINQVWKTKRIRSCKGKMPSGKTENRHYKDSQSSEIRTGIFCWFDHVNDVLLCLQASARKHQKAGTRVVLGNKVPGRKSTRQGRVGVPHFLLQSILPGL